MGKSKKPKKVVNLEPEFVLDPNAPSKQKKSKVKRAPDRPQPEWMFPPDEANPVLNPKAISEEQRAKDKAEHDHAIKFLKYKAVSAPLRPPPPARLLTLIGAFLSTYGLNSTSRLYQTELASRKRLDEWAVVFDDKLPKGHPDLVKIFKEGYKTYEQQAQVDETSSSDSEDEAERKAYKQSRSSAKAGAKGLDKAQETSSSGTSAESSEDSDSDAEMIDASLTRNTKKKPAQSSRTDSTSVSSSDSDADDEKEPNGAAASNNKHMAGMTSDISQNVASPKSLANFSSRTNKAARISSSDSSSSDSDSVEENSQKASLDLAKKGTPMPGSANKLAPTSSDTSSSESEMEQQKQVQPTESIPQPALSSTSSSDDSSSSGGELGTTRIVPEANTKPRTGSSSSETLLATPGPHPSTAKTSISSSSVSDSSDSRAVTTPVVTETIKTKRKRDSPPSSASKVGKTANTPFSRVPKDTVVDEKFKSNQYQPYDYADRAHQDLVVTKGRGFTKEKNKKKRGSYRGGAIDISGGKGVKFDD